MTELMKAVKGFVENWDQGGPGENTVTDIAEALSAHIAEIKRRRETSGESLYWVAPFSVNGYPHHNPRASNEGRDWTEYVVIDSIGRDCCTPDEITDEKQAEVIAAALNAYYGYTPDGVDVLEGL